MKLDLSVGGEQILIQSQKARENKQQKQLSPEGRKYQVQQRLEIRAIYSLSQRVTAYASSTEDKRKRNLEEHFEKEPEKKKQKTWKGYCKCAEKGGCVNNKCGCRKNGSKCSAKCHTSHSCKN